jgi:RNA polymerase sigma-70 factor (ECF subfamily)
MADPIAVFEAVYQEHRQGLFGLALTIAADAAAAEDAVHEAFTRCFSRSRLPDGDPVAYVYAAVRNAAVDQQRRRNRAPRPVDPADLPPMPVLAAEAEVDDEALAQALATLTEAEREVVLLKIWGDLSFRQIGEALALPLTTAASRYQKAMESLRLQLGGAV